MTTDNLLSTRSRSIIGAAWLAALAGLACPTARAQFTAPYDSDFAPAPEKKPEPPQTEPPPESAEPAPAEPSALEPAAGAPAAPAFQLLDRPAGAGFLTPAPAAPVESAAAPRDPGEVRAGMTPIQYDPARFERVREQVDRGEEPGQERAGGPGGPLLVDGDVSLSTAAPRPPPPEVELPTYGTSLS
ncbi:MAG: hypothetical protein HY403_06975, partial [Elusimicrobia bacterium]|nr:hypothetical protein [Elusimicrobiota bacterium]